MKNAISKILFFLLFCLSLLISFLLNPSLIYGKSFQYRNLTIYYDGELDQDMKNIIDLSLRTVEQAAIYTPSLHSKLCLNEGVYPGVVETVLGDDIFTAFSNKIVVLGEASDTFNRFYKWEQHLAYDQFLSHALLHNLQFEYHGLWGSNPLGGHPEWKWEGYVEYEVLGRTVSLEHLMHLLSDTEQNDFDWIYLMEARGTIKRHIRYLTMVKYCFEVLGWSYDELMLSQITEEELMLLLDDEFIRENH